MLLSCYTVHTWDKPMLGVSGDLVRAFILVFSGFAFSPSFCVGQEIFMIFGLSFWASPKIALCSSAPGNDVWNTRKNTAPWTYSSNASLPPLWVLLPDQHQSFLYWGLKQLNAPESPEHVKLTACWIPSRCLSNFPKACILSPSPKFSAYHSHQRARVWVTEK